MLRILFSLLFCLSLTPSQEKWVVDTNSKVVIKGSSNINEFRCELVHYLHQDTLILDDVLLSETRPLHKNRVRLDARAFDCHHKMITRDMQKTLQVEEHPEIFIDFVSMKGSLEEQARNSSSIHSSLEIVIAGVSQLCDIDFMVTPYQGTSIQLRGSKDLCLDDFQLETPSKLLGLIKVEDSVYIDFSLILRQLPD